MGGYRLGLLQTDLQPCVPLYIKRRRGLGPNTGCFYPDL